MVVLYTASERPHWFGWLCGQIFDGEDELDIWDLGGRGRRADRSVHGAEGCDGFLSVDVVDQVGLEDIELFFRSARAL